MSFSSPADHFEVHIDLLSGFHTDHLTLIHQTLQCLTWPRRQILLG